MVKHTLFHFDPDNKLAVKRNQPWHSIHNANIIFIFAFIEENEFIMTKTAIISFDSDNKAVKKIIDGLLSMGVIKLEEYPYNQNIVEKIKRGEKAIKEGNGISIHPDELWK